MMDLIKSWIIQLTGAAMLTAVAMALTPDGRVKKVVALVCGLVMITALISPLIDFDYTSFSRYMSEIREEADVVSSEFSEVNDDLNRLIIEEESEAYILDKGTALGMDDLAVSVSVEWSDEGYWYPSGIEVTTNAEAAKKDELSYYIEAQLGISEEEQIWGTNDED